MTAISDLRILLATAVAPTVWGTTYAVTTQALPPGHPLFAGLARALPAGLLALAVTRSLPRGSWWWRALVLGALNIGMFFPLLFLAAERLPGGVAATLGAIQPLVVAALAAGILGERPTPWRLGAGVLGVIGVGLVVLGPTARLDVAGVSAGLCGALCMALGVVLSKRWGRPPQVSPTAYAGWLLTGGGLVLAAPALLVEGVPTDVTAKGFGGYVWLGLVGGLLAYTLWFRGVRALPAAPTAMLGLLSPLTAAVIGVVALGEHLTGVQVVGMVAALTALVASQRTGRPGRRVRRPAVPSARAKRPGTMLRFVAQAAIWGSSFSLIRLAGEAFSPGALVLSRLALATLVLVAVVRWRGDRLVRGRRGWAITAVGALLANVVPYLLLTYGERGTTAGAAGALIGLTPLLTVLVAAVALRGEASTRRVVVGFVIAFAGIVIVVNPFAGESRVIGALLCLGAATSYAAGYVWARRFQAGTGSALGVAASQLAAATVIQAGLTPALGLRVGAITPTALGAVVILGVGATGYASLLYFRLVRDIGAARAASVDYLVPVFAIAVGAITAGESVGVPVVVGVALILAGLGVGEGQLQRIARRRARPAETTCAPVLS
ncbi:EamA family transporter [Flexivirga meconopsidis]|uniref:EamA family transporter n=1 Tax=Flexivirga meconopsidis TaxID=2977121 RepID=UPI00223F0A3F|nr:EamA family transporter [Flexivirga meconopsidis]